MNTKEFISLNNWLNHVRNNPINKKYTGYITNIGDSDNNYLDIICNWISFFTSNADFIIFIFEVLVCFKTEFKIINKCSYDKKKYCHNCLILNFKKNELTNKDIIKSMNIKYTTSLINKNINKLMFLGFLKCFKKKSKKGKHNEKIIKIKNTENQNDSITLNIIKSIIIKYLQSLEKNELKQLF